MRDTDVVVLETWDRRLRPSPAVPLCPDAPQFLKNLPAQHQNRDVPGEHARHEREQGDSAEGDSAEGDSFRGRRLHNL
jgi:hypothetical protein